MQEVGRAAIWAVDLATFDAEVYARGLRNPVGLALHPKTGALWTAVNERDQLGRRPGARLSGGSRAGGRLWLAHSVLGGAPGPKSAGRLV
jgi:hypothetical protein